MLFKSYRWNYIVFFSVLQILCKKGIFGICDKNKEVKNKLMLETRDSQQKCSWNDCTLKKKYV